MVLPTLEDGSPFAVAEAMACGLPVIVTDSCGSGGIGCGPGGTGWVRARREMLKRSRARSKKRSDCAVGFERWVSRPGVTPSAAPALSVWNRCVNGCAGDLAP